jgi:hypothetical protein
MAGGKSAMACELHKTGFEEKDQERNAVMGVRKKMERIVEALTFAEEGDYETAMKLVKRLEEEGETASCGHGPAEAADSGSVCHEPDEGPDKG